jgi:hypothetical protein
MAVGSLSQRAIDKAIKNATQEQIELAKKSVREKILAEEMGVNPALAKQAADGDISVPQARTQSANQDRRLGVGAEQEALDDISLINSVQDADPEGYKLFQIKQDLSDADKNRMTMAEIAYKKGDPKPLATMYRTMGIAGAVGAGSAVAEESAPDPAIEVAHAGWVDSGTLDGISNETQFERSDAPAAIAPEQEAEETETQRAIKKAISDVGGGGDWDTQTQFATKNAVRAVAGGLTLGHADELEGIVRSVFGGTSYQDEVDQVRADMQEFNAVNPNASFGLDLVPALVTGGALLKAGTKAGYGAGRVGMAEGSTAGVGYAESPEEAVLGAGLGAGVGLLAGKGLDSVIDWSKKASGKMRATIEGGRTPLDDEIDDGILTQNIKVAQKEGNNVMYRTNKGELKKVSVVSINEDKARGATNVVIKDGDNQYAVPLNKIESIEIRTDKQVAEYESLQDFDNARGQYKPKRQIEEKRMTPEGEEVTVVRDATWRDATTAGELWDAMKDGAYRFYNEKLTGADDMLTRVVSKAVGSRFARASQNAVRYSTLAFTKIAEPLRNVAKLADDDRYFKAMVMDFTNARKLQKEGYNVPTQDQVEDYIRTKLGDEDVEAFRNYMAWNRQQKARHVDKLNGRQAFKENDHIHTQLNPEGKKKLFRGKEAEEEDVIQELEFALRDDNAMNSRSRRSMVDLLQREDAPLPRDDFDIILTVDDYMNPFFTDFRRTTNLEQLYQLARVFGLDTADESFQPAQVFERIEKSLVDRGVEKSAAKLAADTMRDDFVGGSKTPNNWIQALNSVGYAGSLAGPKSAILNFHDVLQTMAVYGPKAFRGVTKDMGIDVRKKGIDQNLGEFRSSMFDAYRYGELDASALARNYTREGTDILMKASGFAWTDLYGKNAVTKMVIQDAVDSVLEEGGEGLAKRWGFYFSKRELDLIEKQIQRHGTDVNSYTGKGAELMEELFFAGLGQQQLISSSGRPAAWSRSPNMRFMWALRGFAIKQQALALRQIVENIAEGNTKEAVDYMKRYVMFAAGGFGLVNESRQWLMGDGEFSATGLLMGMGDQIVSTASINTIGLNDYQWGRMMQNGVTLTFLESIVPIGIDVPKDMVMDVVDAIDDDVKGKEGLTAGQRIAYPVAQLPLIKQPSRLFSNLEDNIGLPNPMRQFTDMYIETEVPKDAQ